MNSARSKPICHPPTRLLQLCTRDTDHSLVIISGWDFPATITLPTVEGNLSPTSDHPKWRRRRSYRSHLLRHALARDGLWRFSGDFLVTVEVDPLWRSCFHLWTTVYTFGSGGLNRVLANVMANTSCDVTSRWHRWITAVSVMIVPFS